MEKKKLKQTNASAHLVQYTSTGSCHMRSHSITSHPTQANTPRLNSSHWRL